MFLLALKGTQTVYVFVSSRRASIYEGWLGLENDHPQIMTVVSSRVFHFGFKCPWGPLVYALEFLCLVGFFL